MFEKLTGGRLYQVIYYHLKLWYSIYMKNFRFFISLILISLCMGPVFADSWFVCLSSCQKKENADELVLLMENAGLSGCIKEFQSAKGLFYRVLLDEPFATADEARARKDELNSNQFVRAQKINDLWICKVEDDNKNVVPATVSAYRAASAVPVPYVIQNTVSQLPVNEDYDMDEIKIFDLDNIRKSGLDFPEMADFAFFVDDEKMHSVAKAAYVNHTLIKEVDITIVLGDEGFSDVEGLEGTPVEFEMNGIDLTGVLYDDGGNYYFTGVNEKKNLYIYMEAFDFSYDDFIGFLSNCVSASALEYYPQIKKNLFVLPANNTYSTRTFLGYAVEKVKNNYANERNNADWAVQVVGHWMSQGIFESYGKQLSVKCFDLGTESLAKSNQQLFIREKNQNDITAENHASTLSTNDSWYFKVEDKGNFELSFSNKCYGVSIDGLYSENDLIAVARDLQIW